MSQQTNSRTNERIRNEWINLPPSRFCNVCCISLQRSRTLFYRVAPEHSWFPPHILFSPDDKAPTEKQLINRVVFNWVSKVISEILWFMITSLSDWFKVLVQFFQPIRSEMKPKPILARPCTFSRALCRLREISSSFYWFTGFSCNFFKFWLVYWIVSDLFDWPK